MQTQSDTNGLRALGFQIDGPLWARVRILSVQLDKPASHIVRTALLEEIARVQSPEYASGVRKDTYDRRPIGGRASIEVTMPHALWSQVRHIVIDLEETVSRFARRALRSYLGAQGIDLTAPYAMQEHKNESESQVDPQDSQSNP